MGIGASADPATSKPTAVASVKAYKSSHCRRNLSSRANALSQGSEVGGRAPIALERPVAIEHRRPDTRAAPVLVGAFELRLS